MLFIHITLWSLLLKYVLWACLYHDRHPQDTFAKLPASQWWIVRKVGRFQWERRRNLKWRLRLSRVADSAVLFRDRLVFSFGSLPEPLVRWCTMMHHRTCTSFETGHIGWRLTLFCPVCLRCRISSYPCPFSAQHGWRPLLAFVEPLLSLFLQGKTSSPTSPHLAKPVLILCTHVAHASSHHVIWLFNEYYELWIFESLLSMP